MHCFTNINYMKNVKFITFEGVEGCGKSTQSKMLVGKLQQLNKDVVLTREPGGTSGAEDIRGLLMFGKSKKGWDGVTELLLMSAARRDHTEKVIKPRIEAGSIVICDRYIDSTYAYQGYASGVNIEDIDKVCNVTLGDFKPDLTFIFDLDVEKGMNRAIGVRGKGTMTRYEQHKINFHQKVRKGFLDIAKKNPERCVVIDVDDKSVEEIHEIILEKLEIK